MKNLGFYQIPGSFNTADQEKRAVRAFLDKMGVKGKIILQKTPDRDAGDVDAYIDDVLVRFEVKFESPRRWERFGEYGFEGGWYDPKTDRIKPPKSVYSKSDIWLFYSGTPDALIMLEGYFFDSLEFTRIATTHGTHMATTSVNYETGVADRHLTSVSFVNPVYLEKYKITPEKMEEFIERRAK